MLDNRLVEINNQYKADTLKGDYGKIYNDMVKKIQVEKYGSVMPGLANPVDIDKFSNNQNIKTTNPVKVVYDPINTILNQTGLNNQTSGIVNGNGQTIFSGTEDTTTKSPLLIIIIAFVLLLFID